MPVREAVIRLTEPEIQAIERAVLDRHADGALEVLETIVLPRVEEVLKRPHCKPIFEWRTGGELGPSGPPGKA